MLEKDQEIYLIDDGRIVGAENEKLLGRTEDILETKRVSQKSITNTRSGWKIVLCQSLSEYQRAIREQIVFWLLLAVAVLLVFVFLIYKVTEPVMVSVNEIVDAMKNLEKDNFREKLAIKENDSIEIQKISEGFNDMTGTDLSFDRSGETICIGAEECRNLSVGGTDRSSFSI